MRALSSSVPQAIFFLLSSVVLFFDEIEFFDFCGYSIIFSSGLTGRNDNGLNSDNQKEYYKWKWKWTSWFKKKNKNK